MKKKRKLKDLDYLLIPTGWYKQRKKRAEEELKKRYVKNVLILNKRDSEEDILYLGKKLEGGERVGFVTFPLHYEEYKEIIKRAKRQKQFPRNVRFENIETNESFKQFIYGVLGLSEERFRKGKVKPFKERHENYFLLKLRELVKEFLS